MIFDFSATLCYKYPLFFRRRLHSRWWRLHRGTRMTSAIRPLAALIVLLILSVQAAAASGFEDDLLVRINRYRSTKKLKPLASSPPLVELAGEHSQTMQEQERMSHDGFEGRFKRAAAEGARSCVENVGWNYQTPQGLFEGWRKSPGHNRNMLERRITRAGISRSGAYTTFFACY
jgi:uncharacterized protein YkwD